MAKEKIETPKFRESLIRLEELAQDPICKDGISLSQILSIFGIQGHLVIIIILSLPFLQPIPIVGLSSLLGPLMILMAALYMLGKPPWLPRKIAEKKISREVAFKSGEVALKIWGYLETIIHPRGQKTFLFPAFKVFSFLLITINALLLALPLPIPFTNTVPVLVIICHCLGLLEEDAIIVYGSLLLMIGCVAFFSSVAVGVKHSAPFIWEWMKSLNLVLDSIYQTIFV